MDDRISQCCPGLASDSVVLQPHDHWDSRYVLAAGEFYFEQRQNLIWSFYLS